GAAALEPREFRGAVLVEVVERHMVRVVVAAARDRQVRVPILTGAEDRFPPVGPRAPGHDQVVRIRIGARIHGHRAGPTDAAAALADAVIGPDVGGHARTGGVAVDVAGDALSGIVVRRFDDLEVVQRILHQDLVIAVRRRRDTGPDVERDLLLPGPALLRLDDDDAVR